MKISTKIKRIIKKQQILSEQLNQLKDECHAQGHSGKLQGVYNGNTGNWSSVDDYYWVSLRCPECGKIWSEAQDDVWYDRKYQVMRTQEGILFTEVKEWK